MILYLHGHFNDSDMKTHSELRPFMNDGVVEAGCDEAGRGPLAGPVFAAAVILPPDFRHPLLDDSKKMSAGDREKLRPVIEKEAISFSVREASADEIDAMNILNASIAAMQRAVMSLKVRPEHLLIDGNRFRPFSYIAAIAAGAGPDDGRKATDVCEEYDSIPFTCVIKGDATYSSIAAASVLAKTYRDEYMRKIAAEYPQYGWERNMGYPTREHVEAIRKYGFSPYHRKSFHLKELEPTLFPVI